MEVGAEIFCRWGRVERRGGGSNFFPAGFEKEVGWVEFSHQL